MIWLLMGEKWAGLTRVGVKMENGGFGKSFGDSPPEQPPGREFKPPRDKSGRFYDSGRNYLWWKALALGVPRAILHGQSTGNISKLVQLLEGRTREQMKNIRV